MLQWQIISWWSDLQYEWHVSRVFSQFGFVHLSKTHLWMLSISVGPACLTYCGYNRYDAWPQIINKVELVWRTTRVNKWFESDQVKEMGTLPLLSTRGQQNQRKIKAPFSCFKCTEYLENIHIEHKYQIFTIKLICSWPLFVFYSSVQTKEAPVYKGSVFYLYA